MLLLKRNEKECHPWKRRNESGVNRQRRAVFLCKSVGHLVILMTVMIFKEGLPIFKIAGMKDFLLGATGIPPPRNPPTASFL